VRIVCFIVLACAFVSKAQATPVVKPDVKAQADAKARARAALALAEAALAVPSQPAVTPAVTPAGVPAVVPNAEPQYYYVLPSGPNVRQRTICLPGGT
jgi:hypothetical protein